MRALWCRLVGHDDEERAALDDAWGGRCYHRCRRCGRLRSTSWITEAQIGREVRSAMMPYLRSALYTENPLMGLLRSKSDPG